jgi:hypothetical protein
LLLSNICIIFEKVKVDMDMQQTNRAIENYCDIVKQKLIAKNIAYNNSLQNPISVFNTGSKTLGICARIDDKLNRIKQAGITEDTEDTIEDLIGYLIHLKISINNGAR